MASTVIRQWFYCCLFIVYCHSDCLWEFFVWYLFWYAVLIALLVLQSSGYYCLLDDMWLLSLLASSSSCYGWSTVYDCGIPGCSHLLFVINQIIVGCCVTLLFALYTAQCKVELPKLLLSLMG